MKIQSRIYFRTFRNTYNYTDINAMTACMSNLTIANNSIIFTEIIQYVMKRLSLLRFYPSYSAHTLLILLRSRNLGIFILKATSRKDPSQREYNN